MSATLTGIDIISAPPQNYQKYSWKQNTPAQIRGEKERTLHTKANAHTHANAFNPPFQRLRS
jgi:hypothetical protein